MVTSQCTDYQCVFMQRQGCNADMYGTEPMNRLETKVVCEPPLYCSPTPQSGDSIMTGQCLHPSKYGKPCTDNQSIMCGVGLVCAGQQGNMTCQDIEYAALGEACTTTSDCLTGGSLLECSATTQLCVNVPDIGDGCATNGNCPVDQFCGQGKCQDRATLGEQCYLSSPSGAQCLSNLICDASIIDGVTNHDWTCITPFSKVELQACSDWGGDRLIYGLEPCGAGLYCNGTNCVPLRTPTPPSFNCSTNAGGCLYYDERCVCTDADQYTGQCMSETDSDGPCKSATLEFYDCVQSSGCQAETSAPFYVVSSCPMKACTKQFCDFKMNCAPLPTSENCHSNDQAFANLFVVCSGI
eukprot:gene12795-15015_t